MAWVNLDRAEDVGFSRASWERSEAPSYYDPARGQTMVWVSPEPVPVWSLELVAQVRQEIGELRQRLRLPPRSATPRGELLRFDPVVDKAPISRAA